MVICFLFSICEAFVQRLPFLFYFYYEGSNSRFSHIFNISLSWALMFLYCLCVLLITNLCRAVCQLGADFYRGFFLQLNSLRRWICLWDSLTLGTVCHNINELMSCAISLHFVSWSMPIFRVNWLRTWNVHSCMKKLIQIAHWIRLVV